MLQNLRFEKKIALIVVAMAIVALAGTAFLSVNEMGAEANYHALIEIDDPGTILLTRATDKMNALLYASHRMMEEAGQPELDATIQRYQSDVLGMEGVLDDAERIDPALKATLQPYKIRFQSVRQKMDLIVDAAERRDAAAAKALLRPVDRDGVTLAIDIGWLAINRSDVVKTKAAALTQETALSILSCLAVMLVLIGVVLVFALYVSHRGIVQPLLVVRDQMLALAQGALEIDVSHTTRRDEVGAMARALQTIRSGLQDAKEDTLTDLANRVAFELELKSAFMQQHVTDCALIYIDLDRFKQINDGFGHAIGDRVLRVAAERIRGILGPNDFAARLGGDEFVIFCRRIASRATIEALAETLARDLARPVNRPGGAIALSASVGIAYAGADTDSPQTLLHHADLAMYAAKEEGRGLWKVYRPSMLTDLQYSRALKDDLGTALRNGTFTLVYQPIVDVQTGRVASFETLLRWTAPGRGEMIPAEFIPFAERVGLMARIDDWVLAQACREAAQWPDGIAVSVNISATRLHQAGLIETVRLSLEQAALEADRLEIEITETSMIIDIAGARRTLAALRALGVRVGMDDFGTGYSSLSFLTELPFTRIKIDRSFVRELGHSIPAVAVVRALVNIGRDLGVSVTAEGVETEAQARQLCQEGCFQHQGYLYSPPRAQDDVLPWLQRRILDVA